MFSEVDNSLHKSLYLSWNGFMAILSKQSVTELQRIIKESTDRTISLGEAYAIWHYLIKLLQLLWNVEKRQKPPFIPHQLSLFDTPRKKKS